MKIYDLKENVKWYKRVKIYIPILVFVLVNAFFFPFFYFLLSGSTSLVRSIITSLVISILCTFDSIYTQVINYEPKTVVIKDKKISLIITQRETDFYGTEVKRKIDDDRKDKKVIDDILENQSKYLGISVYNADKYDIIKLSDNKVSLKLEGTYSYWKYVEEKKSAKFVLTKKNKKKKILIDDKYDNYKELIKYFKDKEK